MLINTLLSIIDPGGDAAVMLDFSKVDQHGWAEIVTRFFIRHASRFLAECQFSLAVVHDVTGQVLRILHSDNVDAETAGFCEQVFRNTAFLASLEPRLDAPGPVAVDDWKALMAAHSAVPPPRAFDPAHVVALRRAIPPLSLYVWASRDKAYGALAEPETNVIYQLTTIVAAFLRMRTQRELNKIAAMSHILESAGVGFLTVDDKLRLLHSNHVADVIIASGEHLSRAGDKLKILDAVGEARFVEHLRRQLNDPTLANDAIVPLFGESGAGLLKATMTVFRDHRDQILGSPLVGVTLSPVERAREITVEQLGRAGLTPAESQLAAALLKGQTISQYAASKGLAVATARAHLKRVMTRFGVHRQADLIRTLLDVF